MTTALGVAQTAFQLSGAALQQLGQPVADQSEKTHSLWEHWPVVTGASTCLITAINAVALGIIGNIALGVLLTIAAIGAGVLTIYLWSISSLKDLSAYAEVFSERVTLLAHIALDLTAVNKGLTSTRVGLEADLANRSLLFEKQKTEVASTLGKLEQVTADLKRSEAIAAQIGTIIDSSHGVITQMTTKIGDFVSLNKDVAASSQTLACELSSIQSIGEQLGAAVHGLDTENKELMARKKQADEMAQRVYSQFMQIGELVVGLKKQREALEADLAALQKVDVGLAAHTAELDTVAHDLDKGATDAQAFVDSLKPFDGLAGYLKEKMTEKKAPL